MTDHTPEPYGPYVHGETRHDRIIACVNACAGIPTGQLTNPFVGGLLARLEEANHVIAALQERLKGPVSGQTSPS